MTAHPDSRFCGMGLRGVPAWLVALVGLALLGCGGPNKANIELRKENQALRQQIEQFQGQRTADLARIQGMEKQAGTAPTLDEARLEAMFTVHKVEIGRLSSGADLDPSRPGDEGYRIHITPLDESGEAVKATGDMDIQALDLTGSTPIVLAQAHYDAATMKELWRSFGPIHAFVIESPWQSAPLHTSVSLRITFRDALTGREFTLLHQIGVKLATGATTRP